MGGAIESASERDELLHPAPADAPFSHTETSYFGFNVPEQALNGEVYVWFHPVLGTASAGFFCWRGVKPTTLAAEYFDYRAFLPMPKGDIDDYALPCGLHVTVEEPLQRIRVRWDDAARETRLDLISEALMPPAVKPGGGHFVQAMRVRGELVLRGERCAIDGRFTRDRSWGAPREEQPVPVPPLAWLVGAFDDDRAFHVQAFDSAELEPEWAGRYAFPPPGANLRFGYVRTGGETRGLVRAAKRTERDADGIAPRAYALELEDETGATHTLRGEVVARLPWHPWPNVWVHMCQVRWEWDGRVAWGDAQDMAFNDHVVAFRR